ncbi:MAG: nodulation protein NfeD [Cyclobacteriaceae bacterium]|nr:nodulation protein NfeD [Cyclobacteriaceae bacterium]
MKHLLTLLACLAFFVAQAQDNTRPKVMVMSVRAEIDPRMSRYVKLALEHAKESKADYVIVDMDTFGGALDDTKAIVELLLAFDKPLWVFINSDAASAGALISIACDSIYMSPGATIGAATVVTGEGVAAPDKYQSYMRSIMRSTAEVNHRDPRIAEGMVDERVVIDSVKQAGKVITFTTSEALRHGFCEASVQSIEEILERNHVKNYVLERFELNVAEKIIAFVINPFISGLLILIIIGGIYFELQTPGIGFPLLAAVVALVLYLVPYYIHGLAAYWEILTLIVGVLLLMAEVFIIPGFGVAGIAGIILTVVSLMLIMLNNDYFNFENVPLGDIITSLYATFGGLAGGALLLFFISPRITNTKAFRRMALTDTQERSQGYVATGPVQSMEGKTGTAYTVLRPSGKVLIDGNLHDAYTRGDYIEKGTPVVVIGIEGVTLKVKPQDL